MVQRSTINGISIEAIPVNELRYAFATIEEDLQYIRTKSFSDWIVSDIYLALRNEQSTLYMFYKDDNYIGFVITQFVTDLSGEGTLFVWASYQKPEYNYVETGFEFLTRLAEQKNAVAIEFETSREGWKKVAPIYDFKLVKFTFRKDL